MENSAPAGSTAHHRHTAMLNRLAARAAARSVSSTASEAEPLQTFLSRFADSKASIESEIAGLRSLDGDRKPEIERITTAISDLDSLVADNSYLLPPYELRSSLKSVADLKDSLHSVSSEIAPRKKFSFRTKSSSLPGNVPSMKLSENKTDKLPEIEKSNISIRNSPGFRNIVGATLVKRFVTLEGGGGDFSLSDLDSCEVYLKGRIRALFIHRLKNCKVFCGPVHGSVHIEEVECCLFMLASHQIRVHQAKETDFYLRVRSRPIIEDCTGARFAPYRLFYVAIEEDFRECGLEEDSGNWANVDDFKWLRATQSPNWCLLPQEELTDTRDISDLGNSQSF